jgi:hypothetical protein
MSRTPITNACAADLDGDGVFYVVASTAHGNNYVLDYRFDDEESARALGRKVAAAGSIDESRWVFLRTVYGSAAFEVEEAEASLYANAIRSGSLHEDDPAIPGNIRELL